MTTIALIPAKALAQAKTRLAPELAPDERAALSLRMLRHVAEQVRQLETLSACAVVTGDPQARAIARELQAAAVTEHTGSLNKALDVGRAWAIEQGATAILVVLSDLPTVRTADLAQVLEHAAESDVVIAPSGDGGTNALLLRPPDVIPFRFGRDSARYHHYEAEKRGLRVALVDRPNLRFDVDTPADLAIFRSLAGSLLAGRR